MVPRPGAMSLALISALGQAAALRGSHVARAGSLTGRCVLSTTTRRRARSAMSDEAAPETPPPVDASAPVSSTFLKVMQSRGYLYQCSNLAELDALMCKQVVPAYLGFDATASSLHVGSLLQIMILRHLQKCGHKPVVLVGGGTTKIGDPSGRDTTRQMLTDAQINENIAGISKVRGPCRLALGSSHAPLLRTPAPLCEHKCPAAVVPVCTFRRLPAPRYAFSRCACDVPALTGPCPAVWRNAPLHCARWRLPLCVGRAVRRSSSGFSPSATARPTPSW